MFSEKATKIDEICQVIYTFDKKMLNLVEDFANIFWHSQKTLTLLALATNYDVVWKKITCVS